MDEEERDVFYRDLSSECKKQGVQFTYTPEHLHLPATMHRARRAVIKAAYRSCARYVILPLQDLLGKGADARMNTPGTLSDLNWSWRCSKKELSEKLAQKISQIAKKGNR